MSAPISRALRIARPVGIGLLVFAVDQSTKWWAVSTLSPNHERFLVYPWLGLRLRINSGGTLGILQHHGFLFLMLSAVAMLGFIVLLLIVKFTNTGLLAMGSIIGGGLSTMVDQVRLGGGIDFICIPYFTLNLADIALLIGGLVCIFGPSISPRAPAKV